MTTRRKYKPVEPVDIETIRGYQDAEIFKQVFQNSAQCQLFRVGWRMPQYGFADLKEVDVWAEKIHARFKEFIKTKKYKDQHTALVQKRHEWAGGKITKAELDFAEFRFSLLDPQTKLDFDMERLISKLNKPLFWRDFIENCVMFRDVDSTVVERPAPTPILKWNNRLQRNEIILENVFPDTTMQDFTRGEFIEPLKRLLKKLPGQTPKSRQKKNFKIERQLTELDTKIGLYDFEKADKIYLAGDTSVASDRKRKNRLKQIRHRMKKRTGR